MTSEQDTSIIEKPVEEEMKHSYIDYAMSVIVGRALPDARDGLKPVHRRILYAMQDMGITSTKSYKKSARIVGEVLGKYHPHGDNAVYDALVRMAQEFSLRYPLIDGQGNFGSVDGDSAAAMRYTEARLSKIAEYMLKDIEKDTVDFVPNFDASLKEPEVLPSVFPNLLVNGSSGIAVGMATNMAPHNLNEIVDGILAVMEDPDIEIPDLMEYVKGPDFPTGGIIYGSAPIYQAYATGRGAVKIRAKTQIEEHGNRERIVVTEIPYMVNKSELLKKIADLVKNGIIDGISDLRDESDRRGMRIVIELKRDAMSDIVLNHLFKHTQMEYTFGINNVALVDGVPRTLNLKELMLEFIKHRRTVIRRRTQYELKKAEERAHILEGLLVALDHIDEVIKLIRASKSTDEARQHLMARFLFTEVQAKAILDMKLQKLTGLEREALRNEHKELMEKISDLKDILAREERIMAIIREELIEMREKFGDERRTEIVESSEDIEIEDLIPDEEVVITMSKAGYVKRIPLETYKQQRRGGKGLIGMDTKDEDYVVSAMTTTNHKYILFFTNIGKVYWLKAWQIPQSGRRSKGKPVVNLLPNLENGEKITAAIPVKTFSDGYIVFATRKGVIKKTELMAYSRPRSNGIWAIGINEGDSIVDVALSSGNDQIVLATRNGYANRFDESEVRPMGRTAHGVRGIRLKNDDDEVVSMDIVHDDSILLSITEKGYGKRSYARDYRKTHRGSQGVIAMKINERNGRLLKVLDATAVREILLTSRNGMMIRVPVDEISIHGRATMGVRVMRMNQGDVVVDVEPLVG